MRHPREAQRGLTRKLFSHGEKLSKEGCGSLKAAFPPEIAFTGVIDQDLTGLTHIRMVTHSRALGTLMLHLIDLLDGDVGAAYVTAGLNWRPRYSPLLRALMREDKMSIRALSRAIGISHSAVSQTVSQMQRDGLVEVKPGADARERIVALSAKAEAMIPALQRQWAAITAAADQLDAELSAPLSKIVSEAIEALTQTPFEERVKRAAKALDFPSKP